MKLVRQFQSKDCITALTWAPDKIKKKTERDQK